MNKILIISPTPTHLPYAGNRACILAYSKLLKKMGHDVYFFLVADFNSSKQDIEESEKYWGQDRFFLFKKSKLHWIKERFYRLIHLKFTGYFNLDDYFPNGIRKKLLKIQQKEQFDAVILNYVYLTKIFQSLPDMKKILYTHDVFSNKLQRTGSRWFSLLPNDEAKGLNRSDIILSIQEEESIFFKYLTKRPVYTVYSYFPLVDTPLVDSKTLLYMSGANEYNIEAISFFIKDVLPLLIKKYCGVKLIIGGNICTEISDICNSENIRLLGNISDVQYFYSLGDVFINPTFNGTGLKIKTFEALAFGKVVVSHSHGVEGIYDKHLAPILIANNENDYLARISLLFDDKSELEKMKNRSIEYIGRLNQEVESQFAAAISKF